MNASMGDFLQTELIGQNLTALEAFDLAYVDVRANDLAAGADKLNAGDEANPTALARNVHEFFIGSLESS